MPPPSFANTDAIGSPASTLSPGFTVITNPTVGSAGSSTLRRPPPIATIARPMRRGSTPGTPPGRGGLYTPTPRALGRTPRAPPAPRVAPPAPVPPSKLSAGQPPGQGGP